MIDAPLVERKIWSEASSMLELRQLFGFMKIVFRQVRCYYCCNIMNILLFICIFNITFVMCTGIVVAKLRCPPLTK